jgi:hypothetical protein
VLRRGRRRPSEQRERGGGWRRRGPHQPENWTTPGPGAKCAPTSLARGADINVQLAQERELEAKLAKEYRAVQLLHASIAGEASACGERTRELGRQARDRINANFDVNNPNTPPRASQKLIAVATLLRAMPAPSTPEAQNLHCEARRSLSRRPCNRPRARRLASASREACGATGARRAPRRQFTWAA